MVTRKKTILKFWMCTILLCSSFNILNSQYLLLPDKIRILAGQEMSALTNLNTFPHNYTSVTWQKESTAIGEMVADFQPGENRLEPGTYQVNYALFNTVPLKTVEVEVVSPLRVLSGGQSVGVLLQTRGVTVVGYSPVIDAQGGVYYPAKEAGLNLGDFITKINGIEVIDDYQVADLINEYGANGNTITFTVKRENGTIDIPVQPGYCYDTGSYRIGLYVRDNAAGVGTMTFYEPITGKYGALGHMIADLDGKSEQGENKGIIIESEIQGVKPGQRGVPGEKIGVFVGGGWQGTIEKNCELGVFGVIDEPLRNNIYPELLPVALPETVHEGPAEIITVLEGSEMETFSVEIEKVMLQQKPSGKGLIVKVTDPELLEKTGGIVQGMSGSPIIQDGYLVGAVTHVFINDPTKGYGCLAQWMIEEAEIYEKIG